MDFKDSKVACEDEGYIADIQRQESKEDRSVDGHQIPKQSNEKAKQLPSHEGEDRSIDERLDYNAVPRSFEADKFLGEQLPSQTLTDTAFEIVEIAQRPLFTSTHLVSTIFTRHLYHADEFLNESQFPDYTDMILQIPLIKKSLYADNL